MHCLFFLDYHNNTNVHVPGMCDVKIVFFKIFVSTILKKACCIHDHISYKDLLYFDFTILKMVIVFRKEIRTVAFFFYLKSVFINYFAKRNEISCRVLKLYEGYIPKYIGHVTFIKHEHLCITF